MRHALATTICFVSILAAGRAYAQSAPGATGPPTDLIPTVFGAVSDYAVVLVPVETSLRPSSGNRALSDEHDLDEDFVINAIPAGRFFAALAACLNGSVLTGPELDQLVKDTERIARQLTNGRQVKLVVGW